MDIIEKPHKHITNEQNNHMNKLKKFIKKISKLSHTERIHFLKNIDLLEVNYISEIILNILHGQIKIDFRSHTLLKRMKNYLRKLRSKTVSYKVKKQLLTSIKGLHLLNIIIPYLLKIFNIQI